MREKERTLAALHGKRRRSPLVASARPVVRRMVLGRMATPPDRGAFRELAGALLGGRSSLACTRPVTAARITPTRSPRDAGFIHWPLAFPEVFLDEHGQARADAGFDAVIGNPPWDMVRGDSGDRRVREAGGRRRAQLTDFVREAGIYRVESRRTSIRYQLFVERALQLVRARRPHRTRAAVGHRQRCRRRAAAASPVRSR